MAAKLKWDCSAVIHIDGDTIMAEDALGKVIAQGQAGQADADVVQAAIDYVHPGGQVKLTCGEYRFDKPVVIYNSSTLCGEGRGTVIVPPADDYAFKVMTTEKTETYRPFHGNPGPLYAVIVRDLTIDGESSGSKGKGIYMRMFWSSSFENLWIQNTGNALYLHQVLESDFSNIYLIANGDAEAAEASVIMTAGGNNIHFRGLYMIYPNYIGMELIGTPEGVPRLVFITQSMFHGWLRTPEKVDLELGRLKKDWHGTEPTVAAPYDVIRIRDLDAHRLGMLADVVIRDSRITVAGPGHASVNVINSPVTIANCVVTATEGECVIRASDKARVMVTGNTFHCGKEIGCKYALEVNDAQAIFKDNILNGNNLNVHLAAAHNTVIANNHFTTEHDKPTVWIGDDGKMGSRNIEVSGNIFTEKRAKTAIEVSPLSTHNIQVHNNICDGEYTEPAVS